MPAVLFEGFSELRGQHGFFFPRPHPIAQDDQADSRDASPFVNGQSSGDRGQIDSGINGMPEMSVGSGADEFVILFESDSGAPILSQMPAGPQSDSNADPGECDARNGKRVRPVENVMTENADRRDAAEERNKARDFQKNEAGTRREGFLTDSPACLQRAHSPVHAKHDPWAFDKIMPNQLASPLPRIFTAALSFRAQRGILPRSFFYDPPEAGRDSSLRSE